MQYVSLEDLTDKTDEEILKSMQGAAIESDHYKHSMTTLQLRNMKRTLMASNRLLCATWILVIATIILAISAIFPLLYNCVK